MSYRQIQRKCDCSCDSSCILITLVVWYLEKKRHLTFLNTENQLITEFYG
jgi:hypothetical protein